MSWSYFTRKNSVFYIANELWLGWKEVILHHTWRPTISDFLKFPDGSHWMDGIDGYHRSKGWNGIGYHFVVMPDGLIYVGRRLDTRGAHTVGHNYKAIGVCALGNFDEEELEGEQLSSVKYLLAFLLHRFSIPTDNLYFHRDFANKTCPGLKLDLNHVRNVISEISEEAKQIYETMLRSRKESEGEEVF